MFFLKQGAAHKGVSAMIAVDICGELVCGGGSDGSCTVWNAKTGREKARLTGHQQKVTHVVYRNTAAGRFPSMTLRSAFWYESNLWRRDTRGRADVDLWRFAKTVRFWLMNKIGALG